MANAKTKRLLQSEKYAKIKQDLLDQLERNETIGEYYTDLVDDYMDLWVTKCLLIEDIQRRGIIVKYDNGGGQKGKKKNDSVELMIKVNNQMLVLLSKIGIEPSNGSEPGGDPDEEM